MRDGEKIEISSVMLRRFITNRSEARVSTLDEANFVLTKWACEITNGKAENFEIRIIFEDGLHYFSQLHIVPLSKRFSLEGYIRRQLTSSRSRKPTRYQGMPLFKPTLSVDGFAMNLDADEILMKYAL